MSDCEEDWQLGSEIINLNKAEEYYIRLCMDLQFLGHKNIRII
jgi:hypothetical protein